MTVRQVTQVARHDDRLSVYTEFETNQIVFLLGSRGNSKVVISTEEAGDFANWLLKQKAEIEGRK